jgi:hypothetical protein
MGRLLLASALALGPLLALACTPVEREVVVTREMFGDAWPLAVNSALVLCTEDGGAVLKVGRERYALDEVALAQGHRSAREVAAEKPVDPNNPAIGTWPADTDPLRAVCVGDVAARS